jgi:uncharacterized protein YjiK
MITNLTLWLATLSLSLIPVNEKAPLIKPNSATALSIPESSDIATDGQNFFIVSDRGMLYKTDLNGKVILKADFIGVDFEAVCVVGNQLVVSDEGARKIYYFNKETLKKERTVILNYDAATNRGVEGITYNPDRKEYYLFTEKDPVSCFIYDEQWQLKDYFIIKNISDISAACYYKNQIWVLSDEDSGIYHLNIDTKQVELKYHLNLINPEGFCFSPNGIMTVCSDDMQKIFNY